MNRNKRFSVLRALHVPHWNEEGVLRIKLSGFSLEAVDLWIFCFSERGGWFSVHPAGAGGFASVAFREFDIPVEKDTPMFTARVYRVMVVSKGLRSPALMGNRNLPRELGAHRLVEMTLRR